MTIPLPVACLSPAEIHLSNSIGYYSAVFALAVSGTSVFLSWRRGNWKPLLLWGPVLLLHPAWTMSAWGGDCGYAKRFFSVAVAAYFLAVLVCQVFKPNFSRRTFVLTISGISWIVWSSAYLHLGSSASPLFGGAVVALALSRNALFGVAVVLTAISLVLFLRRTVDRGAGRKKAEAGGGRCQS
jgi:uncharacterized membrane protein